MKMCKYPQQALLSMKPQAGGAVGGGGGGYSLQEEATSDEMAAPRARRDMVSTAPGCPTCTCQIGHRLLY
jgi:Fe-S oxidoreductase